MGPRIFEATTYADGLGTVVKGREISEPTAVARRQAGIDIVVCGDDSLSNQLLARRIEATLGPWKRQNPHIHTAGPRALPHFQQKTPPPEGHAFYETKGRKARKR